MSILSKLLARFTAPGEPGDDTGAANAGGGGYVTFPAVNTGVRATHSNALTYSPVYACVKLITEGIATLPWQVRGRMRGGGTALLFDHWLYPLLHETPNPEMSAMDFRTAMVASMLLWGNGFAEIERRRNGQPVAFWPLHPRRVKVTRDENGAVVYVVDEHHPLPASDVLHFRGLSTDGLVGLSVISLAAQSLSMGMSAERFGGAFFGNSTQLNTVIKHPGTLTTEAQERLREQIEKRHRGVNKAFKPLVLEEGLSIEQIGMPMKDAQFLEARTFQVLEVCRWFNVPPHKLGEMGRATFNNIEHMQISFARDTLAPNTRRMEQEVSRKCLADPSERGTINRLVLNGMMRGDSAARVAYYKAMQGMGAMSINEVRELEDMNPVPNGDLRFVPLAMQTLEQAAAAARADGAGPAPRGLPAPERRAGPLFEPVLATLARKETKAVERAASKADDADAFAAALGDFYGRHLEHMVEAITPLLHGVSGVLGVPPVSELAVRVFAEQYAANSRTAARSEYGADGFAAMLEQWQSARVSQVADELAELVACAATEATESAEAGAEAVA